MNFALFVHSDDGYVSFLEEKELRQQIIKFHNDKKGIDIIDFDEFCDKCLGDKNDHVHYLKFKRKTYCDMLNFFIERCKDVLVMSSRYHGPAEVEHLAGKLFESAMDTYRSYCRNDTDNLCVPYVDDEENIK